jgi:hypothetical protein
VTDAKSALTALVHLTLVGRWLTKISGFKGKASMHISVSLFKLRPFFLALFFGNA